MRETRARFNVGSQVRVKLDRPGGNPRTPTYVRGQSGVVSIVHGVIHNPLDHRDLYPPLYSVVFEVGEVFGGSSRDKLSVDLHEEWLEPV